MNFVQGLESRVLMSITAATLTADNSAVVAEAAATKSSLMTLHVADVQFRNLVARDIKLLNNKATRVANSKLIASLQRTGNLNYTKIAAADSTLITTAKVDSAAGAAAAKQLLLHPGKAAIQNKVNKYITLLNAIQTKLTNLENAVANAATAASAIYSEIVTANPSLTSVFQAGETTGATNTMTFSNAAVALVADTMQLATDLGFPTAPLATLTGLTLFRGDSTGDNQNTQGSVIARGGWTSGLDVQNVPGNYAAELFISTVANPTPSQFLTPGKLSASLVAGANTFYFFADGDDTAGGSATFGLNLFINSAASTSPTLSGYTIPGTDQALLADSAAATSGENLEVTPGAGTLSAAAANSVVTLSSFQVLGVSGQGSTVDLVNSTNTQPFTPPAHPDGIPDTYGTFTITVSP